MHLSHLLGAAFTASSVAVVLIKVVDVVFLLAMTSMTVAAFMMIYTIW
jgi:hypothetical protein